MVRVDSESVLIFVGRMLSPPFLKPLFEKSGHGIPLTRIRTLVSSEQLQPAAVPAPTSGPRQPLPPLPRGQGSRPSRAAPKAAAAASAGSVARATDSELQALWHFCRPQTFP